MDKRSSELVQELKIEFHSAAYKKFIRLFEKFVEENHNKLDVAEEAHVPRLQGQNVFLKKLIKDLTTNRETKFAGM